MSLEQIHIIVLTLAGITALLSFALLLIIGMKHHPQEALIRVYERLDYGLRERKTGFFDYQKLEAFLTAYGARFHLGSRIQPIRYISLRLILAAIGLLLAAPIHWVFGILMAALLFMAPKIYLYYANGQDNSRMVADLQILYNALSVQIRAGVYVTDALAECHDKVGDKRLQTALRELAGDIIVKAELAEALDRFRKQFENRFIDSLCIILLQAQESGQSVDLLADMSEQLKDMQAALLLRRKSSLDRATTMCTMGVFAAILAVVIYACVTSMFSAAIAF